MKLTLIKANIIVCSSRAGMAYWIHRRASTRWAVRECSVLGIFSRIFDGDRCRREVRTARRLCVNPEKPSLVTVGSHRLVNPIDRLPYSATSAEDLFKAFAACRTAKSPREYCHNYVKPMSEGAFGGSQTSSVRETSRVGSPTAPEGSVQFVGI